MGVAGCGKSTLGQALADALRWQFVDGDALHPPANVAKMRAGEPLDDADRAPFLDAVADAIVRGSAAGVVAACSALKHSYRDRLRARAGEILFVLPQLERAALARRLAARADHFMPVSLLDSQLATLEMPQRDESAVIVDGAEPVAAQIAAVTAALAARIRPTASAGLSS